MQKRDIVFVGVKMPRTMALALRHLARAEDRTVSACIRRMIATTLAERGQA